MPKLFGLNLKEELVNRSGATRTVKEHGFTSGNENPFDKKFLHT